MSFASPIGFHSFSSLRQVASPRAIVAEETAMGGRERDGDLPTGADLVVRQRYLPPTIHST